MDDVFDLLLTGEDIVELGDIALELHDVPRAVHDVFLVDVAQLDFGHKLGLDLVDLKALHKVGHDVGFELRTADDRDGLVDVEQDRLETVQQMQAVGLFSQIEVHAATGRLDAPRDPLVQDLTHTHDARIAVDKHIEVAREGILQRGGAEQLRHELLGVDSPFQVDRDAEAGKVGLVADVGNLAHLALFGKLHNALDDDVGLGRVRNLVHLDDALVGQVAPARANLEAAGARVDDALHLLAAVDDLAAGGEVGRGHVFKQVAVGVAKEVHRCGAHLVQVEPADIGRHRDADALVRRHEDVGERGRQKARLLHSAVVAVDEVHGVLVDILEDLGADRRELGFGITRGRIAQVTGIVLAEVAL